MRDASIASSGLPIGWIRTSVGELFEFVYGKGLVKSARKETGPFPVYGSSGIVGYHDDYVVEGPVIIVGRKGAAGAVHLCMDNCWPIDTTYFVAGNDYVDIKFAYHMLQNLRLNQFETSTAIPGLNRDDAYRLAVLLPPLKEQHRIVAKIEALFSELDKGIEALKTAREQLKVYRQAVLKHAFEGKLTAQWREENKDKLESPEQLLARIQGERRNYLKSKKENGDSEAKRYLNKISKAKQLEADPDLSESVFWVRLIDVCTFIVDCHNKTAPYENKGIWLIRTPCIRNGKIHLNEEARFVSEETYDYWARRCPPESGDIIFTREAPMGEAGIVPEGTKLCMGQRMMLLRPPRSIDPKYILYALMEPKFIERMNTSAIGTGVKHLRVGDVEQLMLPLFSSEEQSQIVRKLEEQLSIIDEQETEIDNAVCRAETLRQSILKKAISGQLVLQDPNDEPASTLLERISAKKGAQAQRKGVKTVVKKNVAKKKAS